MTETTTLERSKSDKLTLRCSCGKKLRVKASWGGRRVRCKVCDQVLRIPKQERDSDRFRLRDSDSRVKSGSRSHSKSDSRTKSDSRSRSKSDSRARRKTPSRSRATTPTPTAKKSMSKAAIAARRPIPSLAITLGICLGPALFLGVAKGISLKLVDRTPAAAAPVGETYDVNLAPKFATGQRYSVSVVEDYTTSMTPKRAPRKLVRPTTRYSRYGGTRRAPVYGGRLPQPIHSRTGYEAKYTLDVDAIDGKQQVERARRTYQNYRDLRTNQALMVQGTTIERSKVGETWSVKTLSGNAPRLLLDALRKQAASDSKQGPNPFSHTAKVAQDRPFELAAAPIAKALGLPTFDKARSYVVGRLDRVEKRGSTNWLTVVYRIKILCTTYQGKLCRTPVVADMTLKATFPEGAPTAEGSLDLSGTVKGSVEVSPGVLLMIDNKARSVTSHTKA